MESNLDGDSQPDGDSQLDGDSQSGGETASNIAAPLTEPAVTPADDQASAVDGQTSPDPSASTADSTSAPAMTESDASAPELPKTAGVQELLLLIGMGSSVGAFAVRRFLR